MLPLPRFPRRPTRTCEARDGRERPCALCLRQLMGDLESFLPSQLVRETCRSRLICQDDPASAIRGRSPNQQQSSPLTPALVIHRCLLPGSCAPGHLTRQGARESLCWRVFWGASSITQARDKRMGHSSHRDTVDTALSGETRHACALVANFNPNHPASFMQPQGRDPCGQRHLTSEGLILS